MDTQECRTMIAAARDTIGLAPDEMLRQLDQAAAEFSRAVKERFDRRGEF